jgi:hypothetical protein
VDGKNAVLLLKRLPIKEATPADLFAFEICDAAEIELPHRAAGATLERLHRLKECIFTSMDDFVATSAPCIGSHVLPL